MKALSCSAHPGAPAAFACDSCARLLCPECIQEGHRLLFCRHCGERALPLDRNAPATSTGRRRAAARTAAAGYGWAQAFLYPLRGYGSYAFWGYLVVSAVLTAVSQVLIFGRMFLMLPGLILSLALVQLLFAIARTTAAGENELPDWPDFDFWGAFGRLLLLMAVGLVSLLPAAALLAAAGCTPGALLAGETALPACLAALAVGLVPSMGLWLLAFGATAVFETPWLFFRLDLHLRAALIAPGDLLVATALTGTLAAVSPVLGATVAAAAPLPILGKLLGEAVSVYALFLSAHFAGVLFRRHPTAMERVYLGH